jgi:WD40 repeat protein
MVRKRAADVESTRTSAARLAAAISRIKTAPADPGANQAIGEEFCFSQGKWVEGLPHLAKGDDPLLAPLARRDIASPTKTDLMLALGNDWWNAAVPSRSSAAQLQIKTRAYHWLSAALPGLHGLERMAAIKRMDEMPYIDAPVGKVLSIKAATGLVRQIAFAPDGRSIVSGAGNGQLRMFELITGDEIRKYAGHKEKITHIAIPASGSFFMTTSTDATVRFWDLNSARELHTLTADGNSYSGAIAPDGQMALFGTNSSPPVLLKTMTFEKVPAFAAEGGYASAFSPDGKYFATGGSDSIVHVFDAQTMKKVIDFKQPVQVYSIGFSPDGHTILSGGTDRHFAWDMRTSAKLYEFSAGRDVRDFAFTPDGRFAMAGGQGTKLFFWNVATGTPDPRFSEDVDSLRGVAISRDGRLALSSDGHGIVTVWRLPELP